MLTVTNLSKTFASGDTQVKAVDGLSFSLDEGQFAAVIGRSGSGKSTLLSLLGGLDKPSGGTVQIGDQTIDSASDRQLIRYRQTTVGFVFQAYNLIPNLTALENVMLPMEFGGTAVDARTKRAADLLKQVGLSEPKHARRPARLSGGEQQRVAIARALANSPKLILADEPTGNLDGKTSNAIVTLLHGLSRDHRTTVLIVTHDQAIAKRADVTFELEDGRLVRSNAPLAATPPTVALPTAPDPSALGVDGRDDLLRKRRMLLELHYAGQISAELFAEEEGRITTQLRDLDAGA